LATRAIITIKRNEGNLVAKKQGAIILLAQAICQQTLYETIVVFSLGGGKLKHVKDKVQEAHCQAKIDNKIGSILGKPFLFKRSFL
jgi:hypothetical protein